MPSVWIVNAGACLACALLLGFGYYLELAEGLEPCPLCILQRAVLVALAAVLLVALVHRPRSKAGSRTYGIVSGAVAATGAAIAGWHVRLQNLPPEEAPECGPGLAFMLEHFPLSEAVRVTFSGSGECAEVTWTFLSLSIPTWTVFWFIVLGFITIINNFRSPPGFRPRLFR